MKKIISNILLAAVCAIIGVMVTFQFRVTSNSKSPSRGVGDLVKQVEELTKQRDELQKKTKEYEDKIDNYEKGIADESAVAKSMKAELDNAKKLSGLTDVEGPGIVMKLSPVADVLTGTVSKVIGEDLMQIINELNSSGAEAISINDERYTSKTQMRDIGQGYVIKINGTSFDPSQPFVIKAIGDANILEGAFKLPGGIKDTLVTNGINVEITKQENVKIQRYNHSYEFKYIK